MAEHENEDEAVKSAEPSFMQTLPNLLAMGLGLAAVVIALCLVLDAYEVENTIPATQPGGAAQTQAAGDAAGAAIAAAEESDDDPSVSAAAIVAVLTPIIAAIAGIVGLYFGLSATGSAKGRQAEADVAVRTVQAKAMETSTADAAKAAEAVDSAAGKLKDAAESLPSPDPGGRQTSS